MQSTASILGKYTILGILGKGGFATVYRARDTELDREVALKVLDPLLTRDPGWVQRFRQEARAAARLNHPGIVTIHEIGQVEGSLFIAMQLIPGGTLAELLAAGGAQPWPNVVRLVGEMAAALDYAHGQKVLHRDLKPANVMLDPRSGAVLTDFGFARLLADNSLSMSLTRSGGIVGTPAYIAPEIWDAQPPTAQTDIYALGCIAYELVTGKPLFGGATPLQVLKAIHQGPQLPVAWPEGTPGGLATALAPALAADPTQRYGTAGELAAALKALSVDKLAEPYTALEAALTAGAWAEALDLAGSIRRSEPDYRDVAALEQRALAGIQEEARQQQAEEWRKEAEASLAGGDLEGAELAVRQSLHLAPGNPAGLALLVQVEEQLQKRTAELARQRVEERHRAEDQVQREAEQAVRSKAEEEERKRQAATSKAAAEEQVRRGAAEVAQKKVEEKERKRQAAADKAAAEEQARREATGAARKKAEEKERKRQAAAAVAAAEEQAGGEAAVAARNKVE